MKKNSWCVIAEITQNTPFVMGVTMTGSFKLWPKFGLGGKVKHYFTWYQGDFSRMCYLRKEFDAEADFLAKKMLANPDWALKIILKVEKWSTEFFKASDRQLKYNLKKLSAKDLIKVFLLSYKFHYYSHGIGPSVSWHADCEKERVSKGILKMISEQIKQKKLNLIPAIVFSTLSTPRQQSIVTKEEMAFLRLKNIEELDKHCKKYCWLPYQFKGPAYTKKDYLERWQSLEELGEKREVLLKKIITDRRQMLQEQNNLLKLLKFNQYQLDLIKLAQQMVHIKEYRKMALYHGMYCYSFIFKEIGKRLGLSLDQVRAMNHWEIAPALLKHQYDENELNQRLKECAAYCDGKKYVMYTGQAYKEFMSKIKFEKIKVKESNELFGTCACPGKVRGTVKIINLPEQVSKMNEGDILVAHNTNPNLVPAMKKAAAMVSESGGLTCHTAIVARELKIPCVVGVPQADKILKDGDQIEVDATNGIIKKL
ncbi:MAG: Phosphoenolpyruvate synthase/pyruvate phosphate dikinase [Candidatus Magasanikbacteria bacterium GW2011_GWC2_37_14]|uniref:Phosphoenolpyruvate synthase/pyruvate phosphate dikinase n=1 Tax=Candidatus Magasanikbacteria bacterium GW2011_GWC2_37_14 TaxID=1619046 RepID=A0A0G0IVM3_9BACT|nr:MAG: Phosphoenolpyruvate synthase/pyruvate phosphate dikinase [Candidatus Magasanikbacteria bacterium GW2011_GWC2_37_14]